MSKAKGIKRYFIQAEIGYREYPELFIDEDVDGDWVKYDDIAELKQQNEEMLKELIDDSKFYYNMHGVYKHRRIIEKITGKSIYKIMRKEYKIKIN